MTHRLVVHLREGAGSPLVEWVRDARVHPADLPTQNGQTFPFGGRGRRALCLRVFGIVSCDGAWCIVSEPVTAGTDGVSPEALREAGFAAAG